MANEPKQPDSITNPEALVSLMATASNINAVLGASLNIPQNTDELTEGSTNLYYTDARADARAQLIVNALIAGAGPAYDTLLEIQNELQGNDSDITTILTAQGTNTAAIALNTAKVSADGSINTHSDVDTSGVANNDLLKYDGTNFVPSKTLVDIDLDSLNIKIGEPSTPTSGHISVFEDATTGEIKRKDDAGVVSVLIGKTEQLMATTTNNSWTLLKDFTADVPTDSTLFLSGIVKGQRTDGTFGYAAYGYRFAYANNGGTITEIMDAKDWTEETTGNYNVRSRILSGAPRLEVRGQTGHTMIWTANLQQA